MTKMADTKPARYEDCPTGGGRHCRCGRCSICNHRHHTAIHGPVYGDDTKFWGHAFWPIDCWAESDQAAAIQPEARLIP